MNTCFIVTGKLTEESVYNLVQSYKNVRDKILSTWIDTDPNLLNVLNIIGFIIVLNDIKDVPHITQLNVQIKCIKSGLLKAKKLGYSHCIRSRTDIFTEDFNLFRTVTEPLYSNKLCCLNGQHLMNQDKIDPNITYFIDLIVSGPTSEMEIFYKEYPAVTDLRPPEIFLQETYTGKDKLTRDEIHNMINFCIDTVSKHNIKIYWVPKHGNFELIFDLNRRFWFFT